MTDEAEDKKRTPEQRVPGAGRDRGDRCGHSDGGATERDRGDRCGHSDGGATERDRGDRCDPSGGRATDADADPVAATEAADPAGASESRTLDVIMDLDLPLTVRFGQTFMTLGALTRLGAGAEISLDRAATDPVELLVNGKVIARGDVVAVEGNYAVRITDIVSPSERLINVGG